MKFNLQLFAEATKKTPVDGKKIVYLFRILSKASSTDAVAMAFTTENERSKSNEGETIETKDGGKITLCDYAQAGKNYDDVDANITVWQEKI